MSVLATQLPATVSLSALPNREWVRSLLLHYKHLNNRTYADIAKRLELGEVYTAACIEQQHQMTAEHANRLVDFLDIPTDVAAVAVHVLTSPAVKGHLGSGGIPTEPTEYRLYEILQIYGSSHEKCGPGIMSAIDFNMVIEKVKGEHGEDRIKVTMNGKFLPYSRW